MDEKDQAMKWLAPWTWGRSEWLAAFTIWLPLYLFSFPVAAAMAWSEAGWSRAVFMVAYAPLIFAIRLVD